VLGLVWRVIAIAIALLLWLVPLPPDWVERGYSSSLYLAWQRLITPFSNFVPFALFDLFVCVAVLGVIVRWILRVRAMRKGAGRWRQLGLGLLDLASAASLLYVWFALSWGLNYQRRPLETRLDFDRRRVTQTSVSAMAQTTVDALNRLYPLASRQPWPGYEATRYTLSRSFDIAQRSLGQQTMAEAGTPKSTVWNTYFRLAAIDGMTDPFFLETLVSDDALPVERPFIIAHEWGHLAGYASEAEANFVGWLTCQDAGEQAQYSAWLALYWHLVAVMPSAERRALDASLNEGPKRDLRAIAERYTKSAPRVRVMAWVLYDRFLKANRVSEGIASYEGVVSLLVGTRFSRAWTPILKARE
jgi:hypothetical protein